MNVLNKDKDTDKDETKQNKNKDDTKTSPDYRAIYEFLTFSCILCVPCGSIDVFYVFYVGLAKLHCGAIPPPVMVLFGQKKTCKA